MIVRSCTIPIKLTIDVQRSAKNGELGSRLARSPHTCTFAPRSSTGRGDSLRSADQSARNVPMEDPRRVIGPTDSSVVPRFAGPATFARLLRIDQTVADVDIAVVGVPFDAGTSFRP